MKKNRGRKSVVTVPLGETHWLISTIALFVQTLLDAFTEKISKLLDFVDALSFHTTIKIADTYSRLLQQLRVRIPTLGKKNSDPSERYPLCTSPSSRIAVLYKIRNGIIKFFCEKKNILQIIPIVSELSSVGVLGGQLFYLRALFPEFFRATIDQKHHSNTKLPVFRATFLWLTNGKQPSNFLPAHWLTNSQGTRQGFFLIIKCETYTYLHYQGKCAL